MRGGLVLALLLTGCSFDRQGIALSTDLARDGDAATTHHSGDGRDDLAPDDGLPDDAARDLSTDQRPPDLIDPDLIGLDLSAPDLTALDQWTTDQACTAKYGGADSFILCASDATSCTFYVKTNEDTCQNECAKHGGGCLGGKDDAGGCTPSSQSSSCAWVHSTQICTCSLP